MIHRSAEPAGTSYWRIVVDLGAILAALAAIAIIGVPRPTNPTPPVPRPTKENQPALASTPAVSSTSPKPSAAAKPMRDRAVVSRWEEDLDAASRDRARADERASKATDRFAEAGIAAARAALELRTLRLKLPDHSGRIQRAETRVAELQAERDRIQGELAALAQSPRPRPKPLADQSPVARTPDGEEYHFEVRRNRVTFIELDRLLEQVKTDARMQIRLTQGMRPIVGLVGPVGAFAIRYEMARATLSSVGDLLDPRAASYTLRGWEIVPDHDVRGETFETAFLSASDFARAINRLNPGRDAVTLWVYPDGFSLYRRLRDELHRRGFLVAARPLPEAMPIRGSPGGSLSAGQ